MGGIRRLINTPMRQYIMTEEQLKVMADDYAAKFEPMFRKVARFAFIEGMQLGMEMSKEVIEECSQQ
jgi:hypothetical protein